MNNNIPILVQINHSTNKSVPIQQQPVHIQPRPQPQPFILNGISQHLNLNPVNQSSQPFFIINLPSQNSAPGNIITTPTNLIPIGANTILPASDPTQIPVNTVFNTISPPSVKQTTTESKENFDKLVQPNESQESKSNNNEKPFEFVFGKNKKNKKKVENTFVKLNSEQKDKQNDSEEETKDQSDVMYLYECEYCKKKKKKFLSEYGLSCHLRDEHNLTYKQIKGICSNSCEMIDTDDLIGHLNATALSTCKKCYTKSDNESVTTQDKTIEPISHQNYNTKSLYDKDNKDMDEFTDFKLIDKNVKRVSIRKNNLTYLQKRVSHLASDEEDKDSNKKDDCVKEDVNRNVKKVSTGNKKIKKSCEKDEYRPKIDKEKLTQCTITTRSKRMKL